MVGVFGILLAISCKPCECIVADLTDAGLTQALNPFETSEQTSALSLIPGRALPASIDDVFLVIYQ